MNESAKPRFLLILSLVFGLALAACSSPAEEPPLKGAKIGGPFTLIDQNGRAVTDRDFAGKYRIVYFGFSHCPDVCPVDLAIVGQALRALEKSEPEVAERIVPIFITVDPERDTPPALREYVAAFHPRLVGLTGTPQQVAAAAKAYGIYYSKGDATSGGGYNVSHHRLLFLMGPEGQPIALLPFEDKAPAVAAELRRWVR